MLSDLPCRPSPVSLDELAAADELEPSESGLIVDVALEAASPVDEERIRAAVAAAFPGGLYQSAAVSVAVVDDPAIHQINREYLQHDYPTDVLSFALFDEPPMRLEGQIVVSADTAKVGAVEAGWSAGDELLLYIVHGTLHLVGYDDHDPSAAAAMLAAEAAALDALGVPRSTTDERWRTGAGAYCTTDRTAEDD